MENPPRLTDLISKLLEQTEVYGISSNKYKGFCSVILSFAESRSEDVFSSELSSDFLSWEEDRCRKGEISKPYAKSLHRTMHLLNELAETGTVNFETIHKNADVRKYRVSELAEQTISEILDTYDLEESVRRDQRSVMRCIFSYIEKNTNGENFSDCITDELLENFLEIELQNMRRQNKRRFLTGITYISEYYKANGNGNGSVNLERNFNQLRIRNMRETIVQPFSPKEIGKILSAIDTETECGKRDYAIILLAYDTGLRGIDIRMLKCENINWRERTISICQHKTSKPLTVTMHPQTMNALADYMLHVREKYLDVCGDGEVFISFHIPKRPFSKCTDRVLNHMFKKYMESSEIEIIAGRNFHSLRRSFAVGLSSGGVPLDQISQLLGHSAVESSRPYLSYNETQMKLCAMGFDDIPLSYGAYGTEGYANPGGGSILPSGRTLRKLTQLPNATSPFLERLQESFQRFLDYRNAVGFDTSAYVNGLSTFIEYCGYNWPNAEFLTREMVDSWLITYNYSKNSQANFISYLREYVRYIRFLGQDAFFPDEDYSIKRIAFQPYLFTDEELKRFFDSTDGYQYKNVNIQNSVSTFAVPVLFRMIYCCGMRPGEPLGLQYNDVNLKNGEIYIRESKKHRDRHIFMSDDLCELCIRYDKIAGNRTWFFENNGKPLSIQSLLYKFKTAWENSGLQAHGRPRPYDLRHAFATRTMMKWVDQKRDIMELIPYLSSYMGHKHFRNTMYYVHLLPEKLRESPGIDWSQFSSIYNREGCETLED